MDPVVKEKTTQGHKEKREQKGPLCNHRMPSELEFNQVPQVQRERRRYDV
jgi:hypothetical protein